MAWGMLFFGVFPTGGIFSANQKVKCLLRKGFALLHKPKDYRTYVRRRLRFVCLWGFLYLCQSVKNDFFDRLKRMAEVSAILCELSFTFLTVVLEQKLVQFLTATDSKLAIERPRVGFYRIFGEMHSLCNFLTLCTGDDHFENFTLSD